MAPPPIIMTNKGATQVHGWEMGARAWDRWKGERQCKKRTFFAPTTYKCKKLVGSGFPFTDFIHCHWCVMFYSFWPPHLMVLMVTPIMVCYRAMNRCTNGVEVKASNPGTYYVTGSPSRSSSTSPPQSDIGDISSILQFIATTGTPSYTAVSPAGSFASNNGGIYSMANQYLYQPVAYAASSATTPDAARNSKEAAEAEKCKCSVDKRRCTRPATTGQ